MKRILVNQACYLLVFLFAFLIFSSSCKKFGDDQAKKNSFTWIHNDISHYTNLDTAYVSNGGLALFPYTIIAGENRPGYILFMRVEFNLTSFNAGTYTINAGSGSFNRLTYIDDAGNTLIGAGGTLTIIENSNNYLSGNFSATLINGSGVSSLLTGYFNNMPVR